MSSVDEDTLEIDPAYARHEAANLAWAQVEALGVRPRHREAVEAAGGALALLSRPAEGLASWLAANAPRRGPPLDAGLIGSRLARVQRVVRRFTGAGGELLGGEEPTTQRRLARAADPRLVLFSAGPAVVLDGARSVAVVGTRRASDRARDRAEALGCALAELGVVVVSGGAEGVDRAAHKGALMAGGTSIEVVGERLSDKAPLRHGRVAATDDRLLKLIVFGPGEAQGPWLFARRNRFIAAAADALVVVEGDERSGARYAAEAALALGLPVHVFPGDVDDPRSGLANKLLAETDARPMRSVVELLAAVEGGPARPRRRPARAWRQPVLPLAAAPAPTEPDPPFIAAMRAGPRTLDELAEVIGCSPADAQRQALEWELRGRVVREGGHLRLTDG